jgi:GcrA cell cycle regulator
MVARLQELAKKPLSGSEIAGELYDEFRVHLSRNAIIGKLHRLGIGPNNRSGRPHSTKRRAAPRISQPRQSVEGLTLPDYCEPASIEHDTSQTRCTLLELTDSTCRWPIGHPGAEDFHFCGGPAALDLKQPYCSFHDRKAHQPTTNRRPTQ